MSDLVLARRLLPVLLLFLFASCSADAPEAFESLDSTFPVYTAFLDANDDLVPTDHVVSSQSSRTDFQSSRCPETVPVLAASETCPGLVAYYTYSYFPADVNGSFANVTVLLFEEEPQAQAFFDLMSSELDAGESERFITLVSYDEPTTLVDWTTVDRSASAHLDKNVVLTSSFVSAFQPVEIVDYNRLRVHPVCEVRSGCRNDDECGSRTCTRIDTCVYGCVS